MTIRKHHPKWVDTAITPKRGAAAPKVSWWTHASAPDQREQFIAAAKARQLQKRADFVAGYANAAGESDQ